MVLIDTSVWVGHLRVKDPILSRLLEAGLVLMHPFVAGELACGSLKNREVLNRSFVTLPKSAVATHDETMHIIEHHKIWGRGIGWVDAHLLASAMLTRCRLWTFDTALD